MPGFVSFLSFLLPIRDEDNLLGHIMLDCAMTHLVQIGKNKYRSALLNVVCLRSKVGLRARSCHVGSFEYSNISPLTILAVALFETLALRKLLCHFTVLPSQVFAFSVKDILLVFFTVVIRERLFLSGVN